MRLRRLAITLDPLIAAVLFAAVMMVQAENLRDPGLWLGGAALVLVMWAFGYAWEEQRKERRPLHYTTASLGLVLYLSVSTTVQHVLLGAAVVVAIVLWCKRRLESSHAPAD